MVSTNGKKFNSNVIKELGFKIYLNDLEDVVLDLAEITEPFLCGKLPDELEYEDIYKLYDEEEGDIDRRHLVNLRSYFYEENKNSVEKGNILIKSHYLGDQEKIMINIKLQDDGNTKGRRFIDGLFKPLKEYVKEQKFEIMSYRNCDKRGL